MEASWAGAGRSHCLDSDGGSQDDDTCDSEANQKLDGDTPEAQQPSQPIACSIRASPP